MTFNDSERIDAEMAELSETVNPHCLDQLVQAAPARGLVAGEDVYDQRGLLLVARGQPVDAGTRERLIARRLARPLEATLQFHDCISVAEILACAREVLDDMPAIARLLGSERQSVLAILGQVRLHGGAVTLLTALAHNRPAALRHAVAVALLAIWLACVLACSEQDQRDAAEAGLMHDLGELHLPLNLLDPSARLSFAQWRTLGLHPVVGSAVAREAGYAPQVVLAIREHHERPDGSGYPLGIQAISPLGRLLLSAEMLSALLVSPDHPLMRARIALQMIPGQFPSEVIDVVAERLRVLPVRQAPALVDPVALHTQVSFFLQRLETTGQVLAGLQHELRAADDRALQQLLAQHVHRYLSALHDSGAHAMIAHPDWLADDAQVADEVYRVAREMAWQLPGLHRHAELKVQTRASSAPQWQGVLDALDVAAALSAMPALLAAAPSDDGQSVSAAADDLPAQPAEHHDAANGTDSAAHPDDSDTSLHFPM